MAPPKKESKLGGALIGLGVIGAIWGLLALAAWLAREPPPSSGEDGGPDGAAGAAEDAATTTDLGTQVVEELAGSGDASGGDAEATTDGGGTHTTTADASVSDDSGSDAALSSVARGTAVAYDVCAGSRARVHAGAIGRGSAASLVVACNGMAHVVDLAGGQPRVVATLDEPDAEAGMFEVEARPVIADVTGDSLGDVVLGCSRLSERGGPRLGGAWVVPGVRGAARVGTRPIALGPANVTSLASAELDGRPGHEILVGHMGNWYANETNEVRVFRGGPRPTRIAAIRTDGTETVSVAAVDLTEDGRDDLVIAHEARGGLTVLTGDGRGGFGDARSFSDVLAYGAWRVDLDGDRKSEILLRGERESRLLAGGRDEIPPPRPVALALERVQLPVDVDGDRLTDVVVALGTDTYFGPEWWDISVQRSQPGGSFEVLELVRSAFHPIDLAMADLDGDGALDLAWLGVSHEPAHPERDRVVLQIALGISMRAAGAPPREGPTELVPMPRATHATTVQLR
ncbi:MAG: VCBS repeat-containing protein [Deltaproteobacteria bacterium]|nr:VCBS repeat-containing protein [Deltaproteobacteria bacterium]